MHKVSIFIFLFQQHLCQLNSNEYKTYALKSNHNNTYDMIVNVLAPSTYYSHHNYENPSSSNIDQQRLILSTNDNRLYSPTYPESSLSNGNHISRTLKTFSYVPNINGRGGNESSNIVQLAEQEVIEV